jgi:catechol 2,3-dioxygenase-like lactoylglutathione lyase family enzyme
VTLDHFVIAVSDWEVSNAFYRDVVGAEVVERGAGYAYRFGAQQLNVHGPGLDPQPVARDRVRPGNSDLCFVCERSGDEPSGRGRGPIEDAVAHLRATGTEIELGPVTRHGARGEGTSVYFRDPDGSLLEFIAY